MSMASIETMKCNGCGTHMILDRQESTETASTYWHRCPLCSKVRLTSSLNTNLDSNLQARADAENDLNQGALPVSSPSAQNEYVQPITNENQP